MLRNHAADCVTANFQALFTKLDMSKTLARRASFCPFLGATSSKTHREEFLDEFLLSILDETIFFSQHCLSGASETWDEYGTPAVVGRQGVLNLDEGHTLLVAGASS